MHTRCLVIRDPKFGRRRRRTGNSVCRAVSGGGGDGDASGHGHVGGNNVEREKGRDCSSWSAWGVLVRKVLTLRIVTVRYVEGAMFGELERMGRCYEPVERFI